MTIRTPQQAAVLFTVPYIRLLKRLNFKRLNDKVTGFNGVAEEVIVIDIVDLKARVLHIIGIERLLRKLLSDTDQTLSGGLDRSEVNICTEETPAELHCHSLSCTAAHEAVENEVACLSC